MGRMMKQFKMIKIIITTAILLSAIASFSVQAQRNHMMQESMSYFQQREREQLDDDEMKRIAIKDNWCDREHIKKNLINYINDNFVPYPNIKLKKVKYVEQVTTVYASTSRQRTAETMPGDIVIGCDVVLNFYDGTKSKESSFGFPMNY